MYNITDDLTKINNIPNTIKYKHIVDNNFNNVSYEIINNNITFNNNITNAIIIYD